MDFKEYMENNKWIDLSIFKLDSIYYDVPTESATKFKKVYTELIGKNAIIMYENKGKLLFLTSDYKKVSVSGLTPDYKKRLILANVFREERIPIFEKAYRLNPNVGNILEILQGRKDKLIQSTPTLYNSEIISISDDKNSVLESIYKSKARVFTENINSEAFRCFMLEHKGTYKNTFSIRDYDRTFIAYKNKLISKGAY